MQKKISTSICALSTVLAIVMGSCLPAEAGPSAGAEAESLSTETSRALETKSSSDKSTNPTVGPAMNTRSDLFRDIPSVTGKYSIRGTTVMPYVGAGFGSGYASDMDRSLNTPPSTTADAGLRSQFGQNISPNEFQIGVRFPF